MSNYPKKWQRDVTVPVIAVVVGELFFKDRFLDSKNVGEMFSENELITNKQWMRTTATDHPKLSQKGWFFPKFEIFQNITAIKSRLEAFQVSTVVLRESFQETACCCCCCCCCFVSTPPVWPSVDLVLNCITTINNRRSKFVVLWETTSPPPPWLLPRYLN